jgi:uncharacterized RDD family membrane protein YckC
MKCPKCHYLGFETGDRCKNCGYDFSLLVETRAQPPEVDLPLRDVQSTPLGPMALDAVVTLPGAAHMGSGAAADPARAPRRAAAPSLPLFHPGADDEPLIKLPAAPRPPLSVRRTPVKPRLRAVARPVRRPAEPAAATHADVEAVLDFPEEPRPAATAESSGPTRRLIAAAIDHVILLAIDLVVVYFTLKMAALTTPEWPLLPPVPLVAFLALLKTAYFATFALVGGQTIGKMAVGIRVVAEDGSGLDPARAIQRTLAGALSLLAVGAGFAPILLSADRRGLHDRVARTRVIRS